MKATVFSKAVVMMAVVMASVMNFSASAATPADYVKNEEIWGIERSGFFNGREKWAKGFENQRV